MRLLRHPALVTACFLAATSLPGHAAASSASVGYDSVHDQEIWAAADAGMLVTPLGFRFNDVLPAASFVFDGTADLDGDGLGDVIERRGEQGATAVTTIGVRRGYDGHNYWSMQTPADQFIGVAPMRFGTPARRGLVVATMSRPTTTPTTTITMHITAYDGPTGALVWQWSSKAIANQANWPYVRGLLAGPAGAASNVLVAAGGNLILIDGANGRPHVLTSSAAVGSDITAVDDLDGDRYNDVVSLSPSGLAAWSSSTGRLLWRRSDLGVHSFDVVPDVSGDGRRDLLFHSGSVLALNAATGATQWQANVSTEFDHLGDANGDHREDFVFAQQYQTETSTNVRFTALSGRDASVLWRRTISTPGQPPENSGAIYWSLPTRCDVDADGALDIPTATYMPDAAGKYHLYMVNGRDGTLHDGTVDLGSGVTDCLGLSVDGNGDDYATDHPQGAEGALAVIDGRTRKTIWTTPTPVHGSAWPLAAQLTADNRADVLVSVYSSNPQVDEIRVVDGATGKVRWTYQ
ncbi:MAG: hypothetical protein QOG53_1935 [Frankiales bacterium]|jgi:hypothetical protein|nr:hypothetical protein [Frankiales bacterium]